MKEYSASAENSQRNTARNENGTFPCNTHERYITQRVLGGRTWFAMLCTYLCIVAALFLICALIVCNLRTISVKTCSCPWLRSAVIVIVIVPVVLVKLLLFH